MTSGSAADDPGGEWDWGSSSHVSNKEILKITELVETVSAAEEAVTWIWNCREKTGDQLVIAVDLEGVHLGKGGYATLVQVATTLKNVFIFDIYKEPDIINVIAPLMQSEKVVKVFHDCKADTYALMMLGIDLTHVFDTAVAHVVIQIQEEPEKVPIVPSLNKVVELYGKGDVGTNGEKDSMKDVYRYQHDLWAFRPLTQEMLIYAAADVYCLVPDVYYSINSRIKHEYRSLLHRMIWESMMCHINKPAVKASKKFRKKRKEADLFAEKIDAAESPIELSGKEVALLHHIDLTDDRLARIKNDPLVARTIQAIRLIRKQSDLSGLQNHLPTVAESRAISLEPQ